MTLSKVNQVEFDWQYRMKVKLLNFVAEIFNNQIEFDWQYRMKGSSISVSSPANPSVKKITNIETLRSDPRNPDHDESIC